MQVCPLGSLLAGIKEKIRKALYFMAGRSAADTGLSFSFRCVRRKIMVSLSREGKI